MIRTALRRAIDYLWPKRQKPLARTPIKSVPVSLQRGNLQRTGKPMRKRSAEKVAEDRAWAEIKAAKKAAGCRCAFPACGKPFDDLHHWLSKGRGGKSTIDNAVPCCREHHSWVHLNPIAAAVMGLLASGHTPVTRKAKYAPSQRQGGEA